MGDSSTPGVMQTSSEIHRLSSTTTKPIDLSTRPSIVVPPENMAVTGQAHEPAIALELAKHRLSAIGDGNVLSTPGTPPGSDVTDTYAFAFDIDGVLLRGGKPIPEAIEAMKVLNGQNKLGVKM